MIYLRGVYVFWNSQMLQDGLCAWCAWEAQRRDWFISWTQWNQFNGYHDPSVNLMTKTGNVELRSCAMIQRGFTATLLTCSFLTMVVITRETWGQFSFIVRKSFDISENENRVWSIDHMSSLFLTAPLTQPSSFAFHVRPLWSWHTFRFTARSFSTDMHRTCVIPVVPQKPSRRSKCPN